MKIKSFRGHTRTSQPAHCCWMRDTFLVSLRAVMVWRSYFFCSSCLVIELVKSSASFTALSVQLLMEAKSFLPAHPFAIFRVWDSFGNFVPLFTSMDLKKRSLFVGSLKTLGAFIHAPWRRGTRTAGYLSVHILWWLRWNWPWNIQALMANSTFAIHWA